QALIVPRIVAQRDSDVRVMFFGVYLPPERLLFEKRQDAGHPAQHPVFLSLLGPGGGVPRHIIQAGWERAELIVVLVQSQPDLVEMVGTLNAVTRVADFLDCRHEKADQDRNNGNNDQQLDQRKALSICGRRIAGPHGWTSLFEEAVRSRNRSAISP